MVKLNNSRSDMRKSFYRMSQDEFKLYGDLSNDFYIILRKLNKLYVDK